MVKQKVFIIAEAGVNHNGQLATAKKLIDAAAQAGADAVKFQTFRAEELVSATAPKAAYQKKTTARGESQFKMLKRLELSEKAHHELFGHCQKRGIKFLSTPFDIKSLELLTQMGMDTIKVPSGEITNLPFLRTVGRLRKKVILSTGMADLEEIKRAMLILSASGTPKSQVTVLHCHTEYPTLFRDANLNAIKTIAQQLDVAVGYSDHTLGIEAAIAAAALGATVIEKHFTLSKAMRGPDHKASLEPEELKAMVTSIRHIEEALGSGRKMPSETELRNRASIRRSIVARRDIKAGEKFNEENLAIKRPGTGLSPMQWDSVVGRTAPKDFTKDEVIGL